MSRIGKIPKPKIPKPKLPKPKPPTPPKSPNPGKPKPDKPSNGNGNANTDKKDNSKATADLLTDLGGAVTGAATANAPYQETSFDPNQDSPETSATSSRSGASNAAKYIDAFRSKTSNNGSTNDNDDD